MPSSISGQKGLEVNKGFMVAGKESKFVKFCKELVVHLGFVCGISVRTGT